MKRFLSIFLAIAFLLPACISTPAEVKTSATSEAKMFASEMGYDIKGVSCSGRDSDRDGYTSCTIAMSDGTSKAIECSYFVKAAFLQNTGCKVALPVFQTVQQ